MSYTRWSTDINNVLPWEEYIAMLKDSQDLDSLRQEQIKRGAEWSDWYIYWHCESRDTKDTQLLAIWQAKGTTPVQKFLSLMICEMKISTGWCRIRPIFELFRPRPKNWAWI